MLPVLFALLGLIKEHHHCPNQSYVIMLGGYLLENRKQKKMISGLKSGGSRLRNLSSGCLQELVAMGELTVVRKILRECKNILLLQIGF